MNHSSSRSHTIFRLLVTSVTSTVGQRNVTTESALNFVDLAGSERLSNLRWKRAKLNQSLDLLLSEGKHINTSLFYLCQVITKLSERALNKSDLHIPYRNSNLTKILQSSLEGNSLISVICTATPTLSQFEMTLSTLRFGGTAKTITTQIAANIRSEKHNELLEACQRDIEGLRRELAIAQQGDSIRLHEAKQHLEEKILRLTQLLRTQSKQDHSARNFWCRNVGDLIVHSALIVPHSTVQLRYDEKGLMALERMRTMHKENKKKDQELCELKELKGRLLDSKNNLKNDLKKALSLCKEISEKKHKYKKHNKALQQELDVCKERLSVLERQKGLEGFSYKGLEQLESFFFKALDTVKNMKFRKKYENKFSEVTTKFSVEPLVDPDQLWTALGMFRAHSPSLSYVEEFSLEFENSFYRNKGKKQQSVENSFDNNTMMFANFLDTEFEPRLSPIKNQFADLSVPSCKPASKLPLSELLP